MLSAQQLHYQNRILSLGVEQVSLDLIKLVPDRPRRLQDQGTPLRQGGNTSAVLLWEHVA